MTEQGKIEYNIKGEKPQKSYEIISIRDVQHSKEVLQNFKESIIAILKNKNLEDGDPKWNKLIPSGIVNKLDQLDNENKKYDEFLVDLDMSIYNFQKLKDWEWYSSLEMANGFDIFVKGDFNPAHFISFIHCQNVPLANIRIINADSNKIYELKTFKDYTTYKTLK